jgi:hypothetical protein
MHAATIPPRPAMQSGAGLVGAARETLVVQHSCVMLATNKLDASTLSHQERLEGYKVQRHADSGAILRDLLFIKMTPAMRNVRLKLSYPLSDNTGINNALEDCTANDFVAVPMSVRTTELNVAVQTLGRMRK